MEDLKSYSRIDDYADSYNYGLQVSDYLDTVARTIKERMIPEVAHLIKKGHIRVLDAGPGQGIPDSFFLKELQSYVAQDDSKLDVSYTLVEPDVHLMATLKNELPKLAQSLPNVSASFDFRQQKMEEYIAEKDEEFDVIITIHSIYYMPIPLVLNWCYASLSPLGRFFVLLGARESYFNALNRFLLGIDKIKEDVFPFFEGESLQDYAENKRWKFRKTSDAFILDVSPLFGDYTKEAVMFTRYLIHIDDIKGKYGEEVWQSLVEFTSTKLLKDGGEKQTTNCVEHLFTLMK